MIDMPPTPALTAALDELQAGRGASAEATVAQAARDAEARHGRSSFEHAAALFDIGRFYTAVGDFHRAAEVIRRAADLDLPGDKGKTDRLTYLRNVGEMLRYAGDLQGAEAVLREGLDHRRTFYGPEHSGYAFGLEPLAEVVWLAGKPREAVPMIQQAVEILWRDENSQVLSSIGLRTFIHHAATLELGAFDDLPRLADQDVDAIIEDILARTDHVADKGLCVTVLDDLRRWVASFRGQTDATLIGTVAKIAECQRLVEDHEGRKQTLEDLVEICQIHGDLNQAIKGMQALALAHDAAGQESESEQCYRQAIAWARDYGDHQRLSSALRNYGLYVKGQERLEEAESLLREAVAEGKAGLDPDAQGRALIALGILIQHGGRLDEARELLEDALRLLPPAHSDTLYARSHLNAIETGGSCGCGDMGAAISDALRALVLPSLPPDLLKDLRVEPGGGVQVDLAREPAPDELEWLQRVMDHAMRALRKNYDQSGYS